VNLLHPDAGLTAVINFVREAHAPVDTAITAGKEPSTHDVAVLTGAMSALLDAIDARLPGGTPLSTGVAA
jgi:hypothetical protein